MRHQLLLLLVCVTGSVIAETLVKTTPGNIFMKKTDPAQAGTPLLDCTLETGATFAQFDWKKGEKVLCPITASKETCTDAAYDVDTTNKYNLKSAANKAVDYTYGGAYTCTVTPDTTPPKEPEVYEGSITVVADPVCSGQDISVPKEGSTKITCKLDFSGPATDLTLTLKDANDKVAPGLETSDSEKDPATGKITRSLTATLSAANVGTYTCKIVAGTITETCTMTVTAGIAKATPKDTSALIDKSAEILCTVDGTGYTTVVWTQGENTKIGTGKEDGDPTYETGKEASYTIDEPGKHDLTVKAMKDGLQGKYTCTIGATETYSSELMAIKEAPACSEKDDQVTCVVMYKGNKQPSVHWYKGDDKITGGDPTEGTKDAWSTSTLTTKVEDTDKKYMCKVLNGAEDSITECVGHNAADGLQAKLYQSTLMSAFVLWLWYIMV